MQKKRYQTPEVTFVIFQTTDTILASGVVWEPGDGAPPWAGTPGGRPR